MNLIKICLICCATLLVSAPEALAAATAARPIQSQESTAGLSATAETSTLSARERRAQKRSFRQDMRQRLREARGSDPELILLIILALIIPPLAMFIYEGSITTRFWISLVLTLLGAGLVIGWSLLGLLPAIVYTLYVILTGA